jgi:primosomal protein N'
MRKPKTTFADALLTAVLANNANIAQNVASADVDTLRPVVSEVGVEGDIDVEESTTPNKRLSQRGIENEMRSHAIPTKRYSKGRVAKLTQGTSASFNRVALKGVPGSSQSKAYAAVAMIYDDKTGCLIIDDEHEDAIALYRRLERSAQNCDTTRPNYIV